MQVSIMYGDLCVCVHARDTKVYHDLCHVILYIFCSQFTGRESFLVDEWRHTRHWMLEAIKKAIDDEEQAKDINIVDVYDHLAFAEYKVLCLFMRFHM